MHDCPFFPLATALRALPNLLVAAQVGLGAGGCAPSLGAAVRAYEHGLYPEAVEELRAAEADARRCGAPGIARHALYRGLAQFALGDLAAAKLWFYRVKQALDADSTILSEDDADRLASALAHLPR